MRHTTRWRRTGAALLAVGLLATACGGGDDPDPTDQDTVTPDGEETPDETDAGPDAVDGPAITIGSFNFAESVILAEAYGQALEANGFTVQRNLNLGSRELVFPELESGAISLLPEYVGSALSVGFGGNPSSDLDATLAELTAEFEAIGVSVLEPAPGEDKDVFVVTQEFADEHGVTSLSDLADLDSVTFSGPPECQERDTCYAGLVDTYGLDNVTFQSEQEGSTRIANLEQGNADMTLLFSTQPVITEKGFVVLEDDQGLGSVENIVPVVSTTVLEAYGDELAAVLDSVSALITTEVLLDLNGRVELNAEDPEDVATAFLEENGLV